MENLTLNEVKLLAVLQSRSARPMYGIEILEKIKEKTGDDILLGTLYKALNGLERKGFVESEWGEATEVRRGNRRRYYRLLAKGREAVVQERTALSALFGLLGDGATEGTTS